MATRTPLRRAALVPKKGISTCAGLVDRWMDEARELKSEASKFRRSGSVAAANLIEVQAELLKTCALELHTCAQSSANQ
jgi:hypothetical protein